MEIANALSARSQAIQPEVVALRRDLHAHPELAFEEIRTAGVVKQQLDELGIPYRDGVAKTGVVATLQGTAPGAEDGPTIALRGDMDALPIQEANEVPYKSQHAGKMHACGHDVHTASLLGTARLLHEFRDKLPGTVRLVFQPSEERLPGGASVMIQEGVLDNPVVQGILGQHVMPILEAGKVGIRVGQYMASADEIYLTVRGKGGHAAHPYAAIDPVFISAQLITALQSIVSRSADPRTPSVLSFGVIRGGTAQNILPDEVRLEGTFRTFDEAWRFRAHELIRRTAQGIVEGLGGTIDVDIQVGYPVLHNDEALGTAVREDIIAFMGEDKVEDLPLWPAAEDFAYYTHQVPGCFYRLGTANAAKGITHGLHTPRFDIDENALAHSTGLMAWLAVRQLQRAAQ